MVTLVQLLESVDGDYVGGEALGRSGRTSTESRENNFLGGAGNHSGIFNQSGGLGSANPVRHGHRFEANFEPQLAKFARDVFGGGIRLRRAGGARSNILGKMRQLAVSVIVNQRCRFDGRELLQKER